MVHGYLLKAVANLSTSFPPRDKCVSMRLSTDNLGKNSTISNVSEMENEWVNCICTANIPCCFLELSIWVARHQPTEMHRMSRWWGRSNKPSPTTANISSLMWNSKADTAWCISELQLPTSSKLPANYSRSQHRATESRGDDRAHPPKKPIALSVHSPTAFPCLLAGSWALDAV